MVAPNEREDGVRSGEPPFSRKSQDGIREGEPAISDPQISIPLSLLGADRAFRAQILALGIAWISIGLISAIVLAATLMRDWLGPPVGSLPLVVLFSSGLQLGWLPIGVLTCLKKMRAVYCGLGLSYVVAFSPVFCGVISFAMDDMSLLPLAALSVLSSLLSVVLILQSHRVISLANRLSEEGMR
jgi:hypothetical protein